MSGTHAGRMAQSLDRAHVAYDEGARAVIAHRLDGAAPPYCPYGSEKLTIYWRRGRDRMARLLDQFEQVRP